MQSKLIDIYTVTCKACGKNEYLFKVIKECKNCGCNCLDVEEVEMAVYLYPNGKIEGEIILPLHKKEE